MLKRPRATTRPFGSELPSAGAQGGRRGDDVVDVALDVDAGLFLEFLLPLLLRQDRLEALAELASP